MSEMHSAGVDRARRAVVIRAGRPRSWLDEPGHRAWLHAGFADVISFALGSILPGGGFAYQAADGSPMPGRRPQLFLTARMAHTAALGVRHGIPGSGELLDHAMSSLTGLHADTEHGGWLSEPGAVTRKMTYDHVHVGLASATALTVGHPAAAPLLAQVAEVIDTRLWDPAARRCSSRSRPTGPTPRTTAGPTPTCTASRRSSRWATPRGMPCGTSAGWRSPTA